MPYPKKLYAYCLPDGAIHFGHFVPGNAIAVAIGEDKLVREKIVSTALKHGAVGLRVPGMKEAHDAHNLREKYAALAQYIFKLDSISCVGFAAIGA